MDHSETTRHPVHDVRHGDQWTSNPSLDRRRNGSLFGRFPNFILRVPKKLPIIRPRASKIGARYVNGSDFESLGLGLFLSAYRDMHPIELAVSVGIKFCLDPQILTNPLRWILKRLDDLCLAVLKTRDCFIRLVGRFLSQGETSPTQQQCHDRK